MDISKKRISVTINIAVLCLTTALLLAGCKKEPELIETTPETSFVTVTTETTETTPETSSFVTYSAEEYRTAKVNELNSVPILMYHRIYGMKNSETSYTGGNVDKDGYNRTSEAFENDLRSFYQQGYRMMRLTDYVDGYIDVAFGFDAPSELSAHEDADVGDAISDVYGNQHCSTSLSNDDVDDFSFDDDDLADGLIGDEVLDLLFGNGEEEDRKVLKWMVDNGYDIGNHTWDHVKLGDRSADEIEKQVGAMYKKLEDIIPGQYVNIVALPFGSPENVSKDNPQYSTIFEGTYEGFSYTTKASLLCAWTRSYSPFVRDYNPMALRRIRAYDNNGKECDIEMNFKELNEGRRYISDGDPNTIVYPSTDNKNGDWLTTTYDHQVIMYDV